MPIPGEHLAFYNNFPVLLSAHISWWEAGSRLVISSDPGSADLLGVFGLAASYRVIPLFWRSSFCLGLEIAGSIYTDDPIPALEAYFLLNSNCAPQIEHRRLPTLVTATVILERHSIWTLPSLTSGTILTTLL